MKKPANQILVVFGASGDLANRKIIPALYSLFINNLLPERFEVIGLGRSVIANDEYRKRLENGITSFSRVEDISREKISGILNHVNYYTFDNSKPEDYKKLSEILGKADNASGTSGNYIFYLATPPSLYTIIAGNLAKAGLSNQSSGFRRIIFEKPFGYDLKSCLELNKSLHEIFLEEQIYRIDHYLGKETVQNLLVTRFSNGLFEPLWNRNYIEYVEITSAENIGVENRGGYYDSAGALRDMVQNHLLQMVGMTAMEPPSSLNPNAIRNEILKVFQSFQPYKEEDVSKYVMRGQYTGSRVRGECFSGYRQEKGVDPNSRTETYVAMKFYISNWRWGGVPFYIRTGKRLPTRVTEIVIHFKPTPHFLFQSGNQSVENNQLIIRIQPDEGILLKFGMKEPGAGFNVKNVNMDFHYSDLGRIRVPEAYERLLNDVMAGDSTLYSRDDTVETAWKFLEPIQNAWANDQAIKIYGYPCATWGPEPADDLFEGKNITWRYPCKNLADDGLYCEL